MNRCGFESDIRFDIVYRPGTPGNFYAPEHGPEIDWAESKVVIDGLTMPLTAKMFEAFSLAMQGRVMHAVLNDQQERESTERQLRRREEMA